MENIEPAVIIRQSHTLMTCINIRHPATDQLCQRLTDHSLVIMTITFVIVLVRVVIADTKRGLRILREGWGDCYMVADFEIPTSSHETRDTAFWDDKAWTNADGGQIWRIGFARILHSRVNTCDIETCVEKTVGLCARWELVGSCVLVRKGRPHERMPHELLITGRVSLTVRRIQLNVIR